ncbi:MAG: hypothetical protein JWN25_1212 [Verrucomicrobiales bacterium]|nr:hypothetical protein [Verrucomicrobiales bacterium]
MIPSAPQNPAIAWLLKELRGTFRIGQIVITRRSSLQVRHEADLETAVDKLKKLSIPELRALVQSNESGAFRPLKSAPDLQLGWYAEPTDSELDLVLNTVYPGAVADLYHFMNHSGAELVTSYRAFTSRQTGMYRISTQLTDAEVLPVMVACCDHRVCLKTRLWDVNSARAESIVHNIPCFEPCALMLEFARKTARMNDEQRGCNPLTASDLMTIKKALEFRLSSLTLSKVADFSDDLNKRRLLLAEAKINAALEI